MDTTGRQRPNFLPCLQESKILGAAEMKEALKYGYKHDFPTPATFEEMEELVREGHNKVRDLLEPKHWELIIEPAYMMRNYYARRLAAMELDNQKLAFERDFLLESTEGMAEKIGELIGENLKLKENN